MSRDPRRVRRQRASPNRLQPRSGANLSGPLSILTNTKIFAIVGLLMGAALILSLFVGVIGGGGTPSSGPPQQTGELPDVPRTDQTPGAATPTVEPKQTVKRYDQPPALSIDPARSYTATIKTSKGDLELELYAGEAPQAVNSFVFLAREGYYDNNPVILSKDNSGAAFTAAFGDPTGTGSVRPGFTIPSEANSHPFVKGAVGMGDSQTASNDGRFWISFADQPTWSGKYTNFGQVRAGMDVLASLAQGGARIISITISDGQEPGS